MRHLAPPRTRRCCRDHWPHRDDSDLGRAAPDVDDHRSGGILDRKTRTDGGGHRLLDEVRLAGARHRRRIGHGPLLDLRDPGWNADHHSWMADMPGAVVSLGDEVL